MANRRAKGLGWRGGGAHRGRCRAARGRGLCAGRGFSLAGPGRAVLGGGVRAAVLAHRPGAVARAAGWVVGVSGVGDAHGMAQPITQAIVFGNKCARGTDPVTVLRTAQRSGGFHG